MSKHDFALEEFAARQARVRAEMERQGIDLLLVIQPANVAWLIGARHKAYQELQCLFFTLEEAPLTFLTRLADVAEVEDLSLAEEVRGWAGREPEDPVEAVRRMLDEKGWRGRRIGLEAPRYYLDVHDYLGLHEMLGEALKMDATMLIEPMKWAKSAAEVAYIRKAAEIADAAQRTMVEVCKVGMTEFEVAAEVNRTLMRRGSDQAPSPQNLTSGERTGHSHGAPSDRRIAAGDMICNEFGAAYRRYCSTIGRQFVMGPPTPRQREVFQVVRDACDALIATVRAGIPAREPHLAAKAVIAEAGLDAYRLHTSGYGIGPCYPPSWGENIHFMDDGTQILEPGMVMSVEPPVIINAEGLGVRLVDNVLVTEGGCELLSGFSRDLIEL